MASLEVLTDCRLAGQPTSARNRDVAGRSDELVKVVIVA